MNNKLDKLVELTCEYCGISRDDIVDDKRKKRYVDARSIYVGAATDFIDNKSEISRHIGKSEWFAGEQLKRISDMRYQCISSDVDAGISFVKNRMYSSNARHKYIELLEKHKRKTDQYLRLQKELSDISEEIEELSKDKQYN